MAHQNKSELLNTVLQLLTEEGTAGLAEGIRLLVNEAMAQERSQFLQAQPCERTESRQGHANGFNPKTLATRVGPIQFDVPQVRGDRNFYPSALEKGMRSEQPLKRAGQDVRSGRLHPQSIGHRRPTLRALGQFHPGQTNGPIRLPMLAARSQMEPSGCLSLPPARPSRNPPASAVG